MTRTMQIDLLIHRKVFDVNGRIIGRIDEIALNREGDDYVVEALEIGSGSLVARFRLERLADYVARRLHRAPRESGRAIFWEQIDRIETKSVCLNVSGDELIGLEEYERSCRRQGLDSDRKL